MSTNPQAIREAARGAPISPNSKLGEIRSWHRSDRLRVNRKDIWPELTKEMDSLIKTEICNINRILKGIGAVGSKEEFQAARQKLVTVGEMKNRGKALQEKTEKFMPRHNQQTAEVWKAEVFVGSKSIQVTIALNIEVTGQSIPKEATQIAGSCRVRDVQFVCSRRYTVNLPRTTYQLIDVNGSLAGKTSNTSEPGSCFFQSQDRSVDTISGTVNKGTVDKGTVDEQEMTDESFSLGA